jgi:hypothetical protein
MSGGMAPPGGLLNVPMDRIRFGDGPLRLPLPREAEVDAEPDLVRSLEPRAPEIGDRDARQFPPDAGGALRTDACEPGRQGDRLLDELHQAERKSRALDGVHQLAGGQEPPDRRVAQGLDSLMSLAKGGLRAR